MKLLYRIVAPPLVAVGCLLVAGQFAMMSVRDIAGRFETLRDEKLSAARKLAELDTKLATVNTQLYRTITTIESIEAKAVEAARQSISTEIDAQVANVKQLAGHVDPSLAPEFETVQANLAKYKANAQQALTLAESSAGAGMSLLSSAERSFGVSATALHKISTSVNEEVERLSAEVVTVSSRANMLILLLTVVAAVGSIGLSVWMARRLVCSIAGAVRISESIAKGDLGVVVPPGDEDEVGRLLDSLRHTVQRLGNTLGEIRQAAGSIHTASTEISAGSLDLSVRTEETASNLQQTASSIGMLNDAVGDSAGAAREASALARSAADVARRGGDQVSAVVSTMQEINASARQIGEIIGVIDGIAFQTNILALNAAVEAARAGEQGRGFAVVAAEVRSLAQRSADAAKQIKGLINSSVDKADSGSRLVGDAGTTMTEIVGAVQKVSEMIASISTNADGQTTGIAEVNHAVSQLDGMTQQNAALVEESAAAAESLKQQAARLNDALGAFRLQS